MPAFAATAKRANNCCGIQPKGKHGSNWIGFLPCWTMANRDHVGNRELAQTQARFCTNSNAQEVRSPPMQIAVVFSLGLLLAASPARAWEGGAGIPQIASQSGNKESMSTSHNGSRKAAVGGNRSATISRGAAPAELCSNSGRGERITANPSNYAHIVRTLRPGQTLLLAPGNYPRLNIVNLRGQPGKCIVITGPKDGPPAVIHGVPRFNTVDIVNSSYVALKNVVIDSR